MTDTNNKGPRAQLEGLAAAYRQICAELGDADIHAEQLQARADKERERVHRLRDSARAIHDQHTRLSTKIRSLETGHALLDGLFGGRAEPFTPAAQKAYAYKDDALDEGKPFHPSEAFKSPPPVETDEHGNVLAESAPTKSGDS